VNDERREIRELPTLAAGLLEYELTINRFEIADSGYYTCEEQNDKHESRQLFQHTVLLVASGLYSCLYI
jgi:hypothetical protein